MSKDNNWARMSLAERKEAVNDLCEHIRKMIRILWSHYSDEIPPRDVYNTFATAREKLGELQTALLSLTELGVEADDGEDRD